MIHLTVGCGELCLQNCLSVRWLGYVCYWVSLFVGWGLSLVLGLSVCLLGGEFEQLAA